MALFTRVALNNRLYSNTISYTTILGQDPPSILAAVSVHLALVLSSVSDLLASKCDAFGHSSVAESVTCRRRLSDVSLHPKVAVRVEGYGLARNPPVGTENEMGGR